MKTQLRKITLEHYRQLDDDMAGLCTACGHEQSGCEPDASRYVCEACDRRTVYGPHWYLMSGRIEMMDEMHDNERIYADMAGNVSDQDIRNMTEVLLAWAEAIEKLKTKPDVRTVFLACVQTIGTMGPAYCRLAAVNLAKRAEEGMRE